MVWKLRGGLAGFGVVLQALGWSGKLCGGLGRFGVVWEASGWSGALSIVFSCAGMVWGLSGPLSYICSCCGTVWRGLGRFPAYFLALAGLGVVWATFLHNILLWHGLGLVWATRMHEWSGGGQKPTSKWFRPPRMARSRMKKEWSGKLLLRIVLSSV